MVKRKIKEKEITEHLRKEGFKEVRLEEKLAKWYKKASKRPSCLKVEEKEKISS